MSSNTLAAFDAAGTWRGAAGGARAGAGLHLAPAGQCFEFLHADDVDVDVTDAPVTDLSCLLQPCKRIRRLREWHAAGPVQQIKINPVGLQRARAFCIARRKALGG